MREHAHRLLKAILEGLQEEMSQLQVRLHSKEEEVRSLQEQLEGMDNEMATMREIIDRQDRELEKSILEMQTARGAHRNIDAAQVIAFFPCARETEGVSVTDATCVGPVYSKQTCKSESESEQGWESRSCSDCKKRVNK